LTTTPHRIAKPLVFLLDYRERVQAHLKMRIPTIWEMAHKAGAILGQLPGGQRE
jgi:hypothetical protein